jgi:hypothetical protein
MQPLIITPKTKVAEVLNAYPELEDVLVDLAPAFKKLKNPVLRKTIARVTSLQQAASVGGLPVETIVNRLRKEVGQETFTGEGGTENYKNERPGWFDPEKIIQRLDARDLIESGGHPFSAVMTDLHGFEEGAVYELVTPFLPAPLIDKVKDMGFRCWTKKESDSLYLNYFMK